MSFLKDLLPSAEFKMKALIPNYEIQFSFWSTTQNAGISNLMPAPGKMVQGALFEVPEDEMLALDVKPDVYIGDYERQTFVVMGDDGQWHMADAYRVIDPQGPFKPSRNYVKGMLQGARELELDPAHIKTIEEFYVQSKWKHG